MAVQKLRDAYFALECARNALKNVTAINQADPSINRNATESAQALVAQANQLLDEACTELAATTIAASPPAKGIAGALGRLRPSRGVESLQAWVERRSITAVQAEIRDLLTRIAPDRVDELLSSLPDPDLRPRWRRWLRL